MAENCGETKGRGENNPKKKAGKKEEKKRLS